MTSRWLVAAAARRGFEVRWRTFSLALLNKDRPPPPFLDTPPFRARRTVVTQALLVAQAAIADGDNDAVGRFYAAWGERFHEGAQEPTRELLEAAAAAAGVSHLLVEEPTPVPELDAAVAESLDEALRLAGPDVGSPVLHLDGAPRGTFGPIVSPPPLGDDAGRLWDAVVALQKLESFYELKRGRSGPPAVGAD